MPAIVNVPEILSKDYQKTIKTYPPKAMPLGQNELACAMITMLKIRELIGSDPFKSFNFCFYGLTS